MEKPIETKSTLSGSKTYLVASGGIVFCLFIIVAVGWMKQFGYVSNDVVSAIVASASAFILAAFITLRDAIATNTKAQKENQIGIEANSESLQALHDKIEKLLQEKKT